MGLMTFAKTALKHSLIILTFNQQKNLILKVLSLIGMHARLVDTALQATYWIHWQRNPVSAILRQW